jgi:hypothetical protein
MNKAYDRKQVLKNERDGLDPMDPSGYTLQMQGLLLGSHTDVDGGIIDKEDLTDEERNTSIIESIVSYEILAKELGTDRAKIDELYDQMEEYWGKDHLDKQMESYYDVSDKTKKSLANIDALQTQTQKVKMQQTVVSLAKIDLSKSGKDLLHTSTLSDFRIADFEKKMVEIVDRGRTDGRTFADKIDANQVNPTQVAAYISSKGGFNDDEIKELNAEIINLYKEWSTRSETDSWFYEYDFSDAQLLIEHWKQFVIDNSKLQEAKGVVVDYDALYEELEKLFPTK